MRSLIPQNAPVFLVGDSEFGSIVVLQQLKQWHWFFALRQKGNTGLWLDEQSGWQRLDSLVQKAGQFAWCPNGYLTQSEIHPVSVLIHWQKGEKEPWCLATNLPDPSLTLRYYCKRMWIEEMFADFKKHGFDLESAMLRDLSLFQIGLRFIDRCLLHSLSFSLPLCSQ